MDAHLCVVCGPLGGVDSILNVFLFVPLGIGLALSGVPLRRTVLIACVLSLTVETTQFFFIPGRDATVGDVITNTLGAALGFALTRWARTCLMPPPRVAAYLGLGWGAVWLVIQVVSGFALAPSTPGSIFYGELAPELGSFDLFHGRIMTASVGGIPIRDARLSDADLAGHRFRADDLVLVDVIPSYPTEGIAPILRVVDAEQQEIVLVAQRRREMLFGFHTGAADLRLRPPLFGLRDVFALAPTSGGQPAADTLMLTGRYTNSVSLSAQTAAGIRHAMIPVTTALGWTLILPAQWSIEGTLGERVLGWIWIAFLVLPMGYWAAYVVQPPPTGSFPGRYAGIGTVVVVFLAVGLGVVPLAFGLFPTPVHDWLAAVAGLVLGAVLSGGFRSSPLAEGSQRR